MIVLHDPTTLLHRTVELLGSKLIPAMESPERIMTILEALEASNHKILIIDQPKDNSQHEADSQVALQLLQQFLAETHDPSYLEHVRTVHARWVTQGLVAPDESVLPEAFPHRQFFSARQHEATALPPPKDIFAQTGYYAFDMSTGISAGTWQAALASANLAAEGARLLVSGSKESNSKVSSILALCRPPGHHCTTKLAGGYCYINNACIAVQAWRHHLTRKAGQEIKAKVAILDIDFHHGNGTQDYFYSDPSVLYVSIHGLNEYPYYSGFEDETGAGEGVGFNVNLPLPAGSGIEEYLTKLDQGLQKIQDFLPSFLIVSLGFDTFVKDPLGSFIITTEDYAIISGRIKQTILDRDLPTLVLLEGGYVVEKLGDNVISFLEGLEGKG